MKKVLFCVLLLSCFLLLLVGCKKPHEHAYWWDNVVAPTCTEEGYTERVCDCGEKYVDSEVPALGHRFGKWSENKTPTQTEKGIWQKVCSRCNAKETKETPSNPLDIVANGVYVSGETNVFCVVVDSQICVSADIPASEIGARTVDSNVINFAQENGLFSGSDSEISVEFRCFENEMFLCVNYFYGSKIYTLHKSTVIPDAVAGTVELKMPDEVEINSHSVSWDCPQRSEETDYDPYEKGILSVCAKATNTATGKVTVDLNHYIPLPAGFFDVYLVDLQLEVGEYALEIFYTGGPFVANNQIFVSTDSAPLKFALSVKDSKTYEITRLNGEEDLDSAKSNGKNEVDAYVATKAEADYSDANWTALGDVAAAGKEAIDSATTQQEIKRIVCETKLKIDGIAPQNTRHISDGVYVLADDSWELYVRDSAKDFDKDEAWIENTIRNEGKDIPERPFWPRSFFDAVVVGNQITISYQQDLSYAISEKGNNVYNGTIAQYSEEFFFVDDQLFVKGVNGTVLHFERDSSYNLAEDNFVKIKCAAPKDIKVTVTEYVISFYWDYLSEYGRFGAVMEIEQANGTVDAHHLDVYMNNFATNVQLSELSEGENIVRIYHCGGPGRRNDEKMALFEQSDCVTFVVTVGDEVTVKQILPSNA